MRLSPYQRDSIVSVLGNHGKVFLYGSRTKDDLKGGDIDLLLVVQPEKLQDLRSQKHKLLISIESKIGEQKIDLILATPEMLTTDPFLMKITKEATSLNTSRPERLG